MAESAESQSLDSVHTTSLTEILQQLDGSIAISTYQAGKLIFVRAEGATVNTHFRSFKQPMGLAYDRDRLAVGTKTGLEEFINHPAAARRLDPPGQHDAVFLPRWSHTSGNISGHELEYVGDELWSVNTRFCCLCTFDRRHSFVPRWRPKFVTALAPEDRCHLNGLAVVNDEPKYVTALGATDSSVDWRANKARGGVLIDVPSGEIISRGLSMPHSPRWHNGKLWVLESGAGTISTVDLATGRLEPVANLPGFTRGLDLFGNVAFVGLSQVRETALFSGIPLTDRLTVEERWCGMCVVNLNTGQLMAFLRFKSGVQEVFAVRLLPGMRYPELLNEGEEAIADSFILPDDALAEVPSSLVK